MSSAPRAARKMLETLEVPQGGVLYVQASVDWMQRAGLGAIDTLADLRDWAGPAGTVVMPSYPFHSTHREYLEQRPSFDVRRTAAAIGVLPEMFRRTRGAVRSLDPDFAVAALGADAAHIAGASPSGPDPFGPDSSYQRMLDRGCTLVGLGVSLNTTSFIHVIDARAASGYPAPVYEDRLYPATVIDSAGESHIVERKALRPAFQQRITPSSVNAEMKPPDAIFRTVEVDGARFFKWDLAPWAAWCLAHARERAASRQWPCWLTNVES